MKYLFLAVVLGTFSYVTANQAHEELSPDKELLSKVYLLVEELVSISKDLPAAKQQQFQMTLQQLVQILVEQLQLPSMQEEMEELVRTKISPAKYAQLQKLQKTLMEKIEKAVMPLKKEATVLDKKMQTITQKVFNDNASLVKQMEALQAQIQVEIEQYMQMQQATLQSNGVLP